MRRFTRRMLLLPAVALSASLPGEAQAQVTAHVELYWSWGDGAWRPHRAVPVPHHPTTRAPRRVAAPRPAGVVFRRTPRPVRVPPGHLPPPGFCRLWYPGRPPGHQPPSRPCGSLFRTRGGPGAVIIVRPDHRRGYRGGPEWDGRWRKRKHRGRGRGRPRGRGGD